MNEHLDPRLNKRCTLGIVTKFVNEILQHIKRSGSNTAPFGQGISINYEKLDGNRRHC